MRNVASLRYEVIFKKAFCDVEVFTGFVRDIVGVHIEIDKVETEKSFKEPVGKVKPEFDLFAEDKKNRIIVDIQHEKHVDHYHRFLYYHCAAILEQISSSLDYRPPLTVYTIVVLTSGDTHKTDVAIIDFDAKSLKGLGLGVIKHKVFYLCPKYMNADTPEVYREWLKIINDSLTEQVDERDYQLKEVQKVINHIERNDVSPEERARMIEEYHWEEFEKRAIADGLKEGLEIGLKQGMERGIEQGIERGKLAEKRHLAQVLLAKGMNLSEVAQLVDLTEMEIKQGI